MAIQLTHNLFFELSGRVLEPRERRVPVANLKGTDLDIVIAELCGHNCWVSYSHLDLRMPPDVLISVNRSKQRWNPSIDTCQARAVLEQFGVYASGDSCADTGNSLRAIAERHFGQWVVIPYYAEQRNN